MVFRMWPSTLLSRSILSLLLAIAAVSAVAVQPAGAVTLVGPADVLEQANVRASLTASDPAGLAILYVDGTLTRSVSETGGPGALVFPSISLRPGPHQLRLVIRSSEGLIQSPSLAVMSWRKPLPPLLLAPNGYAGKTTPVLIKAGPSTSSLKLTVNGTVIGTKACTPGEVVNFGSVAVGGGVNTFVVDAANPVSSTTATFKIRRLEMPWATGIIIDKSEFRLYWFKNNVIVKTYPVAIGKPSTPTPSRNWRIDAKYTYAEWGVYGPRRMRLYKQVGPSSFSYTGYGIHGTNQEWVIGTMASHGCIRMFNRDVLELYPQVPLYTMVQTRD